MHNTTAFKEDVAVSIIVPVYNAQSFLSVCIDSILQQSFKSFELILVNDGSTDNSANICDAYRKMDCRIFVIHKNNEGPTSAVAAGLLSAKGVYCGFVDSDDWIAPDLFEILYGAMIRYNANGVRCGYMFYNEKTRQTSGQPVNCICEDAIYSKKDIETKILSRYFEEEGDFTATWSNSRCSKLYQTDILKRVVLQCNYTLRMGEDVELNLRYLNECDNIVLLADFCGYTIRVHENSTCRYFTPAHIDWHLEFIRTITQVAKEHKRAGRAILAMQDKLLSTCVYQLLVSNLSLTQKAFQIKRVRRKIKDKKCVFSLCVEGPLTAIAYFFLMYVNVYIGIGMITCRSFMLRKKQKK